MLICRLPSHCNVLAPAGRHLLIPRPGLAGLPSPGQQQQQHASCLVSHLTSTALLSRRQLPSCPQTSSGDASPLHCARWAPGMQRFGNKALLASRGSLVCFSTTQGCVFSCCLSPPAAARMCHTKAGCGRFLRTSTMCSAHEHTAVLLHCTPSCRLCQPAAACGT